MVIGRTQAARGVERRFMQLAAAANHDAQTTVTFRRDATPSGNVTPSSAECRRMASRGS
jgi:hypothetical protein